MFAVYKVFPNDIAVEIDQPDFTNLIQQFIQDQQHRAQQVPDSDTSLADLPMCYEKITIYPSAVANFYAPSDISGVGGMCKEQIHAVKMWRNGPGRYDTVFVNTNPAAECMLGLDVARVKLFFSISHREAKSRVKYPCTLVHWFCRVGNSPDDNTGMWVVEKMDTLNDGGESPTAILHLDTIVCAAHLMPVFGCEYVSPTLSFTDTLDKFKQFYVNKFADHHSFEIAF
jgi:hypothetical protein